MRRSIVTIGAVIFRVPLTVAEQANCSLSQNCPEETPCCSQYGQCGIGAYCLGGCDPRMSFSLDSCVPEPQCESKVFPMNSMDGIVDISKYLGDAKNADWVAQGTPLVYKNENILLTMPPKSVGTVLASTGYIWYGTVTARMKTSRGTGVVTAFILLSDVKDEIDYEFVGTELEVGQTNYYFQGILNYHNSANISLSDTYNNWHTFEMQWTPDQITWLVDGQVGRVKKRSETWNATANQWGFPQSPSRVQFSIWPGGASSNAPGTIAWAGGPIDWNSEDIKNYGYDYAMLGQVEIKCFNASSAPGTNNAVSYTYSNAMATNDTVDNGNKPTVLKSFLGTGLDIDARAQSSVSNSVGSQNTNSMNTIPGGSANGPGTGSGNQEGSVSITGSAATCTSTGFIQSCDNSGINTSSKSGGRRAVSSERIINSRTLAVVLILIRMLLS